MSSPSPQPPQTPPLPIEPTMGPLASPEQNRRSALRAFLGLGAVVAVGALLVHFGMRGDALTVARQVKSGVLTADTVKVAFQSVGGRITDRPVLEGRQVAQGDTLMRLDATDTEIAIERTRSLIAAKTASLAREREAIRVARQENDRNEEESWRRIESLQSQLDSAQAAQKLARIEQGRASRLIATHAVSQRELDTANSALVQADSAVVAAERALALACVGASDGQLAALRAGGSAQGMTLSAIANARAETENRRHTVEEMQADIAQAERDLQQLSVTLARHTMRAPEPGRILNLLFEPGEIINPGEPAAVLETGRAYFDIYVDEEEVVRFPEGGAVTATVPATGARLSGRVRVATAAPSFADIRAARERGQAALTQFKVRIYLEPGWQKAAKTGMTLEVRE